MKRDSENKFAVIVCYGLCFAYIITFCLFLKSITDKKKEKVEAQEIKTFAIEYREDEEFNFVYVEHELEIAEETVEIEQSVVNAKYLGSFLCTSYCCEKYEHICGTGDGITYSGAPVTAGVSIAVDKYQIPIGSVVYIDGVGFRIAQDIGGKVNGNKIDVAVQTHEEALHWSGYGYHDVYLITANEKGDVEE